MEGIRTNKEPQKSEGASSEGLETAGTKTYEIENGEKIEVAWKKFSPSTQKEGNSSQERPNESSVLFLPGWGIPANSTSINELGSAFANSSEMESISISSSSEKGDDADYLYNEATAIASFIQEQGLKILS